MPIFTIPGIMPKLAPEVRLVLQGRSVPGQDIAGSWTDFGDGLVPGLMDRASLNAKVTEAMAKAKTFSEAILPIRSLCKAAGLDDGGTKILLNRAIQKYTAPEQVQKSETPKMLAFARKPKEPWTSTSALIVRPTPEMLEKSAMSGCDAFAAYPDLHLKALKLARLRLASQMSCQLTRDGLYARRKEMLPKDFDEALEATYKIEDEASRRFREVADQLALELANRKVATAEQRLASAPAQPSGVNAFELAPDEVELEPWLGQELYEVQEAELTKGAGHKYITRVPTAVPGRYRYSYKVTSAAGQPLEDHHIVEGAKFAAKDGSKKGHFKVAKVVGDKVHLEHDESGKTQILPKHALRGMLDKQHVKAIKAEHKAKGLQSIGKTSSGKHIFAPSESVSRAIAKKGEAPPAPKAPAPDHSAEKAALEHLANHEGFSPAEHKEAAAALAAHGGDANVSAALQRAHKLAAKHPTLKGDLEAKHKGVALAHPSKMVQKTADGKAVVTHGPDGKKLAKPKAFATHAEAKTHATAQVEKYRASLGMPNLKGEMTQGKTSDDAETTKGEKKERGTGGDSEIPKAIARTLGRAALGQEDLETGVRDTGKAAGKDVASYKKKLAEAEAASTKAKMKKSDDELDLDPLEKSDGHKYLSRKMGADGKYEYVYSDGKPLATSTSHNPSSVYQAKVLHAEAHPHGTYHVEDHGAGVHATFFKTPREKRPKLISNEKTLDQAKAAIQHHTKTGWARPSNFSTGSAIHPDAKWLKKSEDPNMTLESLIKSGVITRNLDGTWRSDPSKLQKSDGGGHKYITRTPKAGGGYEYGYASMTRTSQANRSGPAHEIVHTESGKPIHAESDHPDHASFSAKDHRDAEEAHTKVARGLKDKMKAELAQPKPMSQRMNETHEIEMADHHSDRHAQAAEAHEKKAKASAPAQEPAPPPAAAAKPKATKAKVVGHDKAGKPVTAGDRAGVQEHHEAMAAFHHDKAAHARDGVKKDHHDPVKFANYEMHKKIAKEHELAAFVHKPDNKHTTDEERAKYSAKASKMTSKWHEGEAATHKASMPYHEKEAARTAHPGASAYQAEAHASQTAHHAKMAAHHAQAADAHEKAAKMKISTHAAVEASSLKKSATAQETKMNDTDALSGLDKLIKSEGATAFAAVTAGAEGMKGEVDALEPNPGRTAPAPSQAGGGVSRPAQGDIGAPMVPLGSMETSKKEVNVIHLGGADEVFAKWAETQLGTSKTELDFSDWQNPHAGGGASISLAAQGSAAPVSNDLELKKSEDDDEDDDDKEEPEDMALSLAGKPAKAEPLQKGIQATAVGMTMRVSNDVDRRAQDLIKSRNNGNFIEWSAGEQLTKSFGAKSQAIPLGPQSRIDPEITNFMKDEDHFGG